VDDPAHEANPLDVSQRLRVIRGRQCKYPPLAAAEHGAVMAATILYSLRAAARASPALQSTGFDGGRL
jgi:hypothetical protein